MRECPLPIDQVCPEKPAPSLTRSSDTTRNFGLDLLRAVAILMVLASHWTCHFGYWLGLHVPEAADILGDIGVELFFVLSGFLIGRILIELVRHRPGWDEFAQFATRRALRTLPLYYLWLTLLLCVFPPAEQLAATALRFASFTQNLLTPFPSSYYFAVTWSLSVEIWFYLLFGFLVVLLARRSTGRAALAVSLAVFLAIPLMLRLIYTERGSIVFLRIDEIAYGVVAAWLYVRRSWLFEQPRPLLVAGISLNMAAFLGWVPLPADLRIPLTSNIEVIGCAMCLPAGLRLTQAPRWFEQPVRWIAARSYALYIMHLTLLVDIAERMLLEPGWLSPLGCAAVAVIAPFPMAELSYRFLEAPILRRHSRPPPAPVLAPALVAASR
jgi:peptidoglycan/LPS O-acetylase OafA/YrhL